MARIPRELLDRLADVPLFSGCSKAELRRIASLGTELRVGAGTELTREGEPGSEFFIVVSGQARCLQKGRTIDLFGPNDSFGEMALLANTPRTATVVAETDMVVRVFDRREFTALLDDAPAIARKMLAALAERMVPTARS